MYWCGPFLGGISAGLLYDGVFAADASLEKTRDYLLTSNYSHEKYYNNPEKLLHSYSTENEATLWSTSQINILMLINETWTVFENMWKKLQEKFNSRS